jgi:hypothetical protein
MLAKAHPRQFAFAHKMSQKAAIKYPFSCNTHLPGSKLRPTIDESPFNPYKPGEV